MNNKVEGILLDFDGVISKVSVENTVDFVYNYINKIAAPMSYNFIKEYMKTVLCFPPKPSVELLFNSLGINTHLDDFYECLKKIDEDIKLIEIEKGFYEFLDFCEKNQI
ncbi:MAG: hypothetical protein SFU98_12325, partial [Leptospiraceae bacterium]|nr:hypothetical protein [Leptospiraceae bacterium]